MFCPHCHNKIPDGSNICPLCYSNLAGVKAQKADAPRVDAQTGEVRTTKKSGAPRSKKPAYTKGSRGSKKSADKAPMIIAFGLIVILLIIIVMIVRSMFGAGDPLGAQPTATPQAVMVTQAPQHNFVIFGQTPTPKPQQAVTVPPQIQVTATPAPVAEVSYKTLRKNDQGEDVVMLQKALAELGYLTGAQDGIYGTGTMTAVKAFQKDHELDADGIAGKMTLEALYSKVTITPMPEVTVGPGDILDLPG